MFFGMETPLAGEHWRDIENLKGTDSDMLREYGSIEPHSKFIQFLKGYGFVEVKDTNICQNPE